MSKPAFTFWEKLLCVLIALCLVYLMAMACAAAANGRGYKQKLELEQSDNAALRTQLSAAEERADEFEQVAEDWQTKYQSNLKLYDRQADQFREWIAELKAEVERLSAGYQK